MIFHRLRVISFSKSLLSTKVSIRKKTDDNIKVHNKEVSKAVEELTPEEAHVKKDLKEKTTECIQIYSRFTDPLPVRPRLLEYKSKSESFRIPSKSKFCMLNAFVVF